MTGQNKDNIFDIIQQEGLELEQIVDELNDSSSACLIATLELDVIYCEEKIKDLQEVLEDKYRLTRLIDVAMFGEESAAKQPSLCDVLSSVEDMMKKIKKYEKALNWIAARGWNPFGTVSENSMLSYGCHCVAGEALNNDSI